MGVFTCNSHEYEGRCLKVLIPKGLHYNAGCIPTLAPGPSEEGDFTSHAVSTPTLLQIKRGHFQSPRFSDAGMIVALRQEIFIGNMVKRAVEPSLAFCSVNWSLGPAADATWTYRMIAHAARVTNFAYGMGRAQYVQKQEEEIRNAVRVICGIAMSNPESMPARLTAGLAVALGGELFDDPSETPELMRLVTEAELHLGWLCLKVSHRLRGFLGSLRVWGKFAPGPPSGHLRDFISF
ncbi:uncharacterized protein BO97DRAFT_442546 [Aspergillus homomorphus CBS 101889]|uniref:Uncharacterized protein n=1 Tax=Aspergillus homomorphus (strain CBS 101889) TaxID=1450537 RepID=A0A395HZY9_ASPHC|nr:hypothetical protein BO97DRAFT_442546 [Aspergillus homomorphus CBS 101889]RAL13055.1 hypothetical protein BO97DRAFT_442546 [Aspergillus homomorphus CBS 101889]